MLTFTPGDKVSTEFGEGVVTHSSHRRVVIDLKVGGTINVVVGTFGYERIAKVGG